MQALTKYVGGHSDLLLGSVTVRDARHWKEIGLHQQMLSHAVSPDDCSLALRGLKTLAVWLKEIESAALQIARWLETRSEIEHVLHPALESCPGHEFRRRDFTGSSGVFSIVFRPEFSKVEVLRFVDAFDLFRIGYNWAGVASLAVAYDFSECHDRPNYQHRIVRLNIGLEEPDDLIADLEQAFGKIL
jgi:cystathionine beta-lyase